MSAGFLDFVREQLRPLGEVAIRRMFGGAGVYIDGTMIALVADDVLYFKADELTRSDFEAEGLQAFSYATKDGRHTIMSYWCVPERVFDEPDEMLVWCRKAIGAAKRSAVPKRPPTPAAGRARKR